MDHRHICTAAMVAHHDLLTAHEALEAAPSSINIRLVLMRHIMLEIANVADLAASSRTLYKQHPDLSELHQAIDDALEFFKYLRNKYVAHFVPELTDKTFEWMPFTYEVLGSADPQKQYVASWFALETAINTYTNAISGHKIFNSETDLNYPPDLRRFLNYLGDAALGAIAYISRLIDITRQFVEVPDMKQKWVELALKAGETDFVYLAKRKR